MRCFVAIELTDEVRRNVGKLQESLRSLPGVRWTRPKSVHLTVKFLGNIDDQLVPDICRALDETTASHEAFDLEIEGVGCFPPRANPRIIWVGAKDDPPGALVRCVGDVEQAMAKLGFPPESRPYTPHATIGRVNDRGGGQKIRERLAKEQGFRPGGLLIEELVLFRSDLRPAGAVYTPVHRAGLGPANAQA